MRINIASHSLLFGLLGGINFVAVSGGERTRLSRRVVVHFSQHACPISSHAQGLQHSFQLESVIDSSLLHDFVERQSLSIIPITVFEAKQNKTLANIHNKLFRRRRLRERCLDNTIPQRILPCYSPPLVKKRERMVRDVSGYLL